MVDEAVGLDPLFDLRVGHVLDRLRELADGSVHCVVTSPPYYGLRSYEVEPTVWGGDEHEHEWGAELGRRSEHARSDRAGGEPVGSRGQQANSRATELDVSMGAFCSCGAWLGHLGLEPTPELFIEHLVGVFREVRRVLHDGGSVWVNLGDTYATTSTYNVAQSMAKDADWKREERRPSAGIPAGMKAKDLMMIPAEFALAMRRDGWWLRSENIWRKLGAMPESVLDRTSRTHEMVYHFTKSARYFYDTDAVREPYAPDNRKKRTHDHRVSASHENHKSMGEGRERWAHPDGKIKRTLWDIEVPDPLADFLVRLFGSELDAEVKQSVWEIATANYGGAHFAVFPMALPTDCVKASTSEKGVCPACRGPWRRVVESVGESVEERQARQHERYHGLEIAPRSDGGALQQGVRVGLGGDRRTVGWEPSCECRDPGALILGPFPAVPATVLDPFVGSGTTMVAARRLGRASVGIELSSRYAREETVRRLVSWFKDESRPREPDGHPTLFEVT